MVGRFPLGNSPFRQARELEHSGSAPNGFDDLFRVHESSIDFSKLEVKIIRNLCLVFSCSNLQMSIYETRRNNLRALIDSKASGNMAEFGRLVGRERAQIKQYLSHDYNGGRSIGERVARDIETKLGVANGLLDADEDAAFRSPPGEAPDQSVFSLLDVRAACGAGLLAPEHPEVVSMMSMPIGMAQSLLGTTNKAGAVKIVTAANDSMTPTIEPDDLLFVDTSTTEYMSEGVYLLVHDGHLICKRLSRPGKDILVSSDNPHYKAWKWSERPDQTRIVGRVLRALPIQFKKFSGD